ncbi:MAG TPA: hypothetical protein DCK93_09505, partial [Blastocatellia bacterium]|nr:hypothetical protein [Blastocatellia bacterium]
MKYLKISLAGLIVLVITAWLTAAPLGALAATVQAKSTALERGYRTGYSDGYNSGYGDTAAHATRDYQNKDEYQRADRNYNEAWGTIEDYRDGYQQGFEAGYAAGYDRRPFDSSIPTGLKPRGTVDSSTRNAPDDVTQSAAQSANQNATQNSTAQNDSNSGAPISGPVSIPRDTILVVELQSSLSTDVSKRGDRFQARVLQPREFEGAIVDGRITNVKRAGKVKGTSELQLSFDAIHMPDNRTSAFSAEVVEIVDMGNRDGAVKVDSEGGVKGRDSTRDDVSKVGASTGIGAIIGA